MDIDIPRSNGRFDNADNFLVRELPTLEAERLRFRRFPVW